VRFNPAYAAYARSLGYDAGRLPPSWREIPAVPTLAFKEATLATFDEAEAVIAFETSGTTAGRSGRHLFEASSLALYDAALLAGFDHFVLGDPKQRLRYALLVPARRDSSLGYMMRRVAAERGDGPGRTYVDASGGRLDLEGLRRDLAVAYADGIAVCLAGTAFAFVALLDALGDERLPLRPGSRIMETGGFKGRTRSVERGELYAGLARCFGVGLEAIVAEYGMTELTSQYYDEPEPRGSGERAKSGPPWLRAIVVGADGREVAPGEIGLLRHVDLANRGSVLAVQTEDLALRLPPRRRGAGFVLLGRDPRARLRGCSLDAEALLARRS
jgi:hypothetical protein